MHLNTLSIAQFTDSSEDKTEIAHYNSTLKQLIITYNLTASGNIPDGRTVVLEYHNSKIGIAVVVIVFVAILTFITIILIAYVYFRDEPEIKATSFSVSLCMFLGCYLMLLFVPFLLMESLPDGQLGLSGALICNILVIPHMQHSFNSQWHWDPMCTDFSFSVCQNGKSLHNFCEPTLLQARFFSNTFLFI
jgi:amino acid transporter